MRVPTRQTITASANSPALRSLPFVTHFAPNTADPTRLVIGGSTAVWESGDQGETITSIGNVTYVNDFAYGHPSNADALWTAGGGVFARFTNGGTLADTLFPTGDALDVVMAPSDSTQAYVVGGSSVWVTAVVSGARTWTQITGDLNQLSPRTLRSIVYVPSSSGDRLVVGADGGVFVTSAPTPGFWTRVGTNLPNALVFDVDYDASRDLLGVGTMGRGAWTIPNASQLNRAPIARCANVTVSADASCLGSVPLTSIDSGSTDPDGDPITRSVSPVSPYTLGTNSVTLTIADNQGGTSKCTSIVTVEDTSPPVFGTITNTTTTLCDPNGESLHVAVPTATDNCVHPPLVTGQVIASSDPTLSLPINVNTSNGTVTLSAGTHTIRWTATDGPNTTTATQTVAIRPGVYATQSFSVLDRSFVRSPSGALATVINSGSGITNIGSAAHTGDVLSRGPVTIGDRAQIDGAVRSGSTVSRSPTGGSTVSGGVFQNQMLTFPPIFSVDATFPPTNVGNVTVNNNQTLPVAPASYNQVTAYSHGTAQLRAGTYFMNSLDVEPQATVSINQSGGTILVKVKTALIWHGTDLLAGGSFTGFTFAYFGTADVTFDGPFTGILVAPNAAVTIGAAGGGQTFTGQFYARSITVRPDVNLVCREDF
jgi:hypothetical protein